MINSYDLDGVINMGDKHKGLRPSPNDIIITGRSFEEMEYTKKWLHKRAMYNSIVFNQTKFNDKSREDSGQHKARTINKFWDMGIEIGLHFEDDPVQADIIERECPRVKVVRIVHDLVEKENVWHGDPNDKPSTGTDV